MLEIMILIVFTGIFFEASKLLNKFANQVNSEAGNFGCSNVAEKS